MLHSAFEAAFRWWGHRFARRRIAADLDGLYVRGLDELGERLQAGPAILAANHSSWWDSLILVELTRRLGLPCHFLVDEAQFRHHRFFTSFGAVSIDLDEPKEGIQRAAEVLQGPGDLLWIFPQGRYLPPHRRPLQLKPGVQWIARLSGAPVVPVAMQYAFLQADRPAAFVRIGSPTDDLEADLVALLDAIDEEVVERSAAALPADRATRWLSSFAATLERIDG